MRARGVLRRASARWAVRRPPECPDGWVTAAPDFVGLGVQRAGTTWWHHLVTAHPDVVRGREKELHYFHRYANVPFTAADVERYHRYFPRPPGRLAGEWSPGYLSHFWVPDLLARAAPDARFLVILRDPVERFRSGLLLQSQTRPPSFSRTSTAFRLGQYADQLDLLFRAVPREQVLVLQYERCAGDPKAELTRTYSFLGVEDGFVPADLGVRRNELPGSKRVIEPERQQSLVRAYEPDVARLAQLGLDLDLALWPDFAHLA
jgi:hypothetical protein